MSARLTPKERQLREMNEKELEDNIHALCKLFGHFYYHTRRSEQSEPGYPDCTIIGDNRLIIAELKTQIGKVSPSQVHWLDAFKRSGVEVYLWRPEHWVKGEIISILRKDASFTGYESSRWLGE